MNDDQLKRSLQSVGKACFVKYYKQFSDEKDTNEDLIGLLMQSEGYMESGAKTRVLQSRRIIREGRAGDALQMVADSSRLTDELKKSAENLLLPS